MIGMSVSRGMTKRILMCELKVRNGKRAMEFKTQVRIYRPRLVGNVRPGYAGKGGAFTPYRHSVTVLAITKTCHLHALWIRTRDHRTLVTGDSCCLLHDGLNRIPHTCGINDKSTTTKRNWLRTAEPSRERPRANVPSFLRTRLDRTATAILRRSTQTWTSLPQTETWRLICQSDARLGTTSRVLHTSGASSAGRMPLCARNGVQHTAPAAI